MNSSDEKFDYREIQATVYKIEDGNNELFSIQLY